MLSKHKMLGACALLVLIYTLQFLTARAGLQGSITPVGLTILRFYAAGALFVPYLCSAAARSQIAQLGLIKIATLALFAGLPYLMVINTGISLTSAGYVAAVGPGSIVLFSCLLPLLLLGAKLDRASLLSTALITLGILLFIYRVSSARLYRLPVRLYHGADRARLRRGLRRPAPATILSAGDGMPPVFARRLKRITKRTSPSGPMMPTHCSSQPSRSIAWGAHATPCTAASALTFSRGESTCLPPSSP